MCCGELAAVDRPPVVLIFDALILRQIQVPQINVGEGIYGITLPGLYPALWSISLVLEIRDAFFLSAERMMRMMDYVMTWRRRRRGSTTSGPFLMVA